MTTFCVYDGQDSISRTEYENTRMKSVLKPLEIKDPISAVTSERICELSEANAASKTCAHTVYIDGSCVGNGSNNAKAGIGLFWGDNHPWNISNALTQEHGEILTNNKAELRAAIRAVEIAREHNLDKLVINSDSKYVVLGITQWINQWLKNNWKNASGDKVKNKEDWTRLLSLVGDCDVEITWNHVPGHSGVAGNEEADSLAVQGANGISRGIKMSADLDIPSNNVGASSRTSSPVNTNNAESSIMGQTDREEQLKTPARSIDTGKRTPARSIGRNLSDTPIPGCINGFNTTQKRKKTVTDTEKGNVTLTSEEGKFFRIVTNIETVLENVLLEIHQTRQESFSFKQEVCSKLETLPMKQNVIEESISNLSKDFATNRDKTINQMEKTNKIVSEMDKSSCDRTAKEVKSGIVELQKDIHSRIEIIKNCTQTTDNSVKTLKRDLDMTSRAYSADIENLQSSNRDMQESISEVKRTVNRTKDTISDIERSMSVFSEPDGFTKINQTSKPNPKDGANSSSVITVDSVKTTDDQEITFASIASRNKTSGTMDSLSEENKQNEPIELDLGNIDEEITINKDISLTERNQVNRHTQNRPERANDEERIESYRKPLVCLIGDSISGQVAASYLGKATNSFVKKLRAPKIEDIVKHTNDVKGAKVVVIHSGINNLREKECTSTSVLTLKEAVLGLKEASPDSKFLISKAAPVGRRALEIERNIFNAEAEKSLTDTIDNNLSYIDHGNLANRGSIVKDLLPIR